MRVLKVSIQNNKLRFLFFCGTVHSISNSEWRDGMKSIYFEHHKVLLLRREGERVIFSQAL